MIKKVQTQKGQVSVKDDKLSSIPHDFEPVSRDKQDEQSDPYFKQMGDNVKFAAQRTADDEEDDDDSDNEKYTADKEASDEILQEDDEKDLE